MSWLFLKKRKEFNASQFRFALYVGILQMLKPRVERLGQSQLSEKYKVSYAIRLTPMYKMNGCTKENVTKYL